MKRIAFVLILAAAVCLCLGCPPVAKVHSFGPYVPQGGRAVSIAVRPADDQAIYVASDTGGLFGTADGGNNWRLITSLPLYTVTDVAYAPSNSSVVIALAGSSGTPAWSYKIPNDGGIWRSWDYGDTWSQPPGSTPPPSDRCTSRTGAWSVSFEPDSSNVYVGTDCGVAISHDLGATWTHVVPDPTVPVNSDKSQDRVLCVLAQKGGRVNLATPNALLYSTNGGASWNKAKSGPPPGGYSKHALAASSFDNRHIFVAWSGGCVAIQKCDYRLFLTIDGGENWNQVSAPDGFSQLPFVKTTRVFPGEIKSLDVYFGVGDGGLFRQAFVEGSSGPQPTGTWTPLISDHNDFNDLAFDSSGTHPILLATDGGVHKTTDNGANWTLTGGGHGGYNALQITEVTGTLLTGPPGHQDLYYGTQDNRVVASPDGGATWPSDICCEGAKIRVRAVSNNHSEIKVTGWTFGGLPHFLADAHLNNPVSWPDAPASADVPFFLQPQYYIQNTRDSSANPAVNTFMLTRDTGTTWSPAYNIPQDVWGVPNIAGPDSNPTIYQAVRRPGLIPTGESRIGLVKITNLYGPGPAVVSDADVLGFGAMGLFATSFVYYTVFGVDPSDANHMIFADVETNQMKFSTDGGQNWFVDQTLTDLVTDSSSYAFSERIYSLVHSIAFDPYNSCHVLVGTAQNGVIRSLDGGHTWEKVFGSDLITNISDFYLPSPYLTILASSYGRGLWTLDISRPKPRPGPCPLFPWRPGRLAVAPPALVDTSTGAHVSFKDFGGSQLCPHCQYVVVKNGRITDIEMDGLQVQKVSISGGSIYQLDGEKKELPLQIANSYAGQLGAFSGNPVFLSLVKTKTTIRGLVVEGTTLKAIITSDAELPFQPSRVPYIRILSGHMSGGVGGAIAGGKLIIQGDGFAPNLRGENRVRVWLGGELMTEDVKVDGDGKFAVEVQVESKLGAYEVVVEQMEGKRLSLDKTMVIVRSEEPKVSNLPTK